MATFKNKRLMVHKLLSKTFKNSIKIVKKKYVGKKDKENLEKIRKKNFWNKKAKVIRAKNKKT